MSLTAIITLISLLTIGIGNLLWSLLPIQHLPAFDRS
jgi:hypothetical protein